MINLNVLYEIEGNPSSTGTTYTESRGMLIGFTEGEKATFGLIVSEDGRIHLVELDNIKVVR